MDKKAFIIITFFYILLHFATLQHIYRFGDLSTEETQEITDNAIPVTTKKPTKYGMRLLNGTYPLRFP